MRDISALSTYLAQSTGLEPVILVEVDWGGTTGVKTYAKKAIGTTVSPNLIDCGNLSQTKSQKIYCAIQSTTIQLQDLDGSLRLLAEDSGIEGKVCKIYQSNSAGIAKVLIFSGLIEGPISWTEKSRVLSFDAVSSPADILIGTKLTDDVLAASPFSTVVNISSQVRDEVLPYTIGCVENAPAFKLTSQFEAVTTSRILFYHPAISDPETPQSTCIDLKATKDNEEIFNGYPLNSITQLEIGGIILAVDYQYRVDISGTESDTGVFYRFLITDYYPTKYNTLASPLIKTAARDLADPDCENPKVFWLEKDGYNLVNNYVGVGVGGSENGVYAFVQCTKQEGRKCYFEEMWTELYTVTVSGVPYNNRRGYLIPTGISLDFISSFTPDTYVNWLDSCQEQSMTHIFEVGSRVRVWDTTINTLGLFPEIYIVNTDPAVITSVKAPISRKNVPQEIPWQATGNTYYGIVDNWNGSTFTALILPIPLSEYPEEGWGDNIFVSQRSATGVVTIDGTADPIDPWGNASKVIEYLIGKFSSIHTTDSSFDTVAAKIAKYPIGMCLTIQRSLFEVIGEIAYQSRCLLTLDGDTFKIKYLSENPTSALTINDDLVLADSDGKTSLVLSWREKHDLKPRMNYQYRKSFDLSYRKLSLIENLSLNPTGESSITFDHFHHEICSKISAAFWLKRESHLWRHFTFDLPLEGLALEIHDAVTIDFSGILGSYTNLTGSIKGEVIQSSYSIEKNTVKVTVELPIGIGSTTVDTLYWAITDPTSMPENYASPDTRCYHLVDFFYPIAPHTFESHSNINRYLRRTSETSSITGNAIQEGDILTWDSTGKQWVPTAQSAITAGSGSGGTTFTGVPLHGHNGMADGGYLQGLSGGL